jgi:preprotein translocase subunit SecF
MMVGTYSSIFIATPVLADLKEREPQYRDLAVKVNRRLAGGRATQRAADTAGTPAASATAAVTVADTAPADEDDEPAGPDTVDGTEQDGGVTVPAAAPRPVIRQQRVAGNPQRRPGAKKKRR